MEKYEVMLTAEQLKKAWEGTEWGNPFENFGIDSNKFWDFLYETKRCPDVLECWRFPSLKFSRSDTDCANEDANELLNLMSRMWRETLIEEWYNDHMEEAEEQFNIWWWSTHNPDDYSDD